MDRNGVGHCAVAVVNSSPPARVAWIETKSQLRVFPYNPVATREGGVDRNPFFNSFPLALIESPPARVAWIETRRRSSWSGT